MTYDFPARDFDDWASSYDSSILTGGFPLDGYISVLETIFKLASPFQGAAVLDLGIGTGNLAKYFTDFGCSIWGLDFSEEMLKHARIKIPEAVLGNEDIRSDWPMHFKRQLDRIVSAYTFHHFTLEEKVTLVQRLFKDHLVPGGKLVIGDIAFQNAADEDACRRRLGSDWEQELYWLADESATAFNTVGISVQFRPISYCASVFQFSTREPEA